MRLAYADPPYLGCCKLYDHHHEGLYGCWDDLETHRALISDLTAIYDGWALSGTSGSLVSLLPLCPAGTRVAAWCKSFSVFKKGVRPAYAWEPVLFFGGRNPPAVKHPPPAKGGAQTTPKDFFVHPITLRKGLTGAKPEPVCAWILQLLGARVGDVVDDLFPGTGSMGRAVEALE